MNLSNAIEIDVILKEIILNLFAAYGAQELSEILDECRLQYSNTTVTVKDVRNALHLLTTDGEIRKEVVRIGDHKYSPSFAVWGLPSDFLANEKIRKEIVFVGNPELMPSFFAKMIGDARWMQP